MSKKVYMVPNPPLPNRAIEYDAAKCIGCNACTNGCRNDVMMPNPENGQPPIVLYPEECWYCGCCVEDCPREGAIIMHHPLKQNLSVRWKRKETGEIFRLGMDNPPPPNSRPPSGRSLGREK